MIKPKFNFLVPVLSILLIITVAIACLFYFQIQKLSKELSKYQTQASPAPTATTDPTANWKTYTNQTYNYQFKCPQTSKLITDAQAPIYGLPYLSEGCDKANNQFRIQVTKYFNSAAFTQQGTLEELSGASLSLQNWQEKPFGKYKMFLYQTVNLSGQIEANIAEVRLDNEKKIYIRGFDKTYFDQILSTFKFLK